MSFEQWLAAKGLENETLSDAMRTTLQAAWRAEHNPPKPGDKKGEGNDDYDAVMEGLRLEEVRKKRITSLTAEAIDASPNKREELDAIGRRAIGNKWDVRDTELALLRVSRPDAPTMTTDVGGEASALVLEAGFAQATGTQGLDKVYPEKVLEAAHKQFGGGLTILPLLEACARQNGYRGSVPAKANLEEVMRYAFRRGSDGGNFEGRADSGVSTINIGGILSNIGNKKVRVAFMSVDQSWRKVVSFGVVTDFKQMSTYSLTGPGQLQPLSAGGFITHGTLGEVAYTNQAKTQALMLGLDRRDLINDNAGALDKSYAKMGRAGGTSIAKDVWGKYLNNASFWTAGNGTALTGAGTALSLAGLANAEAAFMAIKDPDGEVMGVMPKLLVAPPALRPTAWNLMNSTATVGSSTTDKPVPNGNPFSGLYDVVSSPYMQDATLTGNSATAWYLQADPNEVSVLEVVFLNGKDTPTVESTDADFNQLGLQIRVYWDWGANLQEYRGGVRSAGS